jgi:hypothetical protein
MLHSSPSKTKMLLQIPFLQRKLLYLRELFQLCFHLVLDRRQFQSISLHGKFQGVELFHCQHGITPKLSLLFCNLLAHMGLNNINLYKFLTYPPYIVETDVRCSVVPFGFSSFPLIAHNCFQSLGEEVSPLKFREDNNSSPLYVVKIV